MHPQEGAVVPTAGQTVAGLERFRAKWTPVRVKKTRQKKDQSPVLIQSEPTRLQDNGGTP